MKAIAERVALFGGSFDPPHIGHESIVIEALEQLKIDKLIILPTFLNPFKTSSSLSPQQRLELSFKLFGKIPKVLVEDYEIKEGKAVRTAQTLAHFQKKYRVKYIIIGADNLESIVKWYNFEWINSEITWVIATRKGHQLNSDALRKFMILEVSVDMSSTEIRNKQKKQTKEGNR